MSLDEAQALWNMVVSGFQRELGIRLGEVRSDPDLTTGRIALDEWAENHPEAEMDRITLINADEQPWLAGRPWTEEHIFLRELAYIHVWNAAPGLGLDRTHLASRFHDIEAYIDDGLRWRAATLLYPLLVNRGRNDNPRQSMIAARTLALAPLRDDQFARIESMIRDIRDSQGQDLAWEVFFHLAETFRQRARDRESLAFGMMPSDFITVMDGIDIRPVAELVSSGVPVSVAVRSW